MPAPVGGAGIRVHGAAYQKLAMGSVWDARDVEAWIREHRPELAEDAETD